MRKLLICCAVALCCLSLVFGQAQVRKRIATDAQAKIIEDHEFAGLEINLDDYAVPDVSVNPEQRQKRRQYRQDINKGWEIIAVTKGMVFLYNPKNHSYSFSGAAQCVDQRIYKEHSRLFRA